MPPFLAAKGVGNVDLLLLRLHLHQENNVEAR
jgi:hypothetical protein